MDNPFSILEKQLAQIKVQNQQMLECLQRLTEKESEDRLLSIGETCALFQPAISRQTLYAYEKQNLLQRRMIGAKVCFLKSETLAALKTIKRYKTGGK